MTIVGDGEQSRDFTHVGDVARANLMAMEKLEGQDSVDADGLTINIGTGKNYTINEVAKMVGDEMSSYEPSRQNIPHRVGETKATLADTKLAKQILEWEPLISLDKGIKDLRSYYNNRADKLLNGERAL
jgi:UDP-glucose 4-epimerase